MADIMLCQGCEQELGITHFPKHDVYSCLKWDCDLFRWPQLKVATEVAPVTETPRCRVCNTELNNGKWSPYLRKIHSKICRKCNSEQRKSSPKYMAELAQKHQAYRFARDLQIPAMVADGLRYKSREYIKGIAKELGRKKVT